MTPQPASGRIQQRRTKGWRKPEGAVSVVRGTEWGNPFKVGTTIEGVLPGGYTTSVTVTPALAVALYERWLGQVYGPGIFGQIKRELGGKVLMCFCPVGQPCHADLLMEIARTGEPVLFGHDVPGVDRG